MTGRRLRRRHPPIVEAHRAGDRDLALERYTHWLPRINGENRQAKFLAAKALMKKGGVIACEAPSHPWPELHPEVRDGLIAAAKRLDPLVLRWGGEIASLRTSVRRAAR